MAKVPTSIVVKPRLSQYKTAAKILAQAPKPKSSGGFLHAVTEAMKPHTTIGRLAVGAVKELGVKPAMDLLKATAGVTTGMRSVRTPRDLLGREATFAEQAGLNFAPVGKVGKAAVRVPRIWAERGAKGAIEYTGKRPAARIPSLDPNFEITKAAAGDPIVGLGGGLQEYRGPNVGRKIMRERIKDWDRAIREAPTPGERMALQQQRAHAIDRMMGTPLQWAFNVVEAGTKKPHATLNMNVGRHGVDVEEAVNLREIQHGTAGLGTQVYEEEWRPGTHHGAKIPGSVMIQLLRNAFGPEKPVESYIVNPKLAYVAAMQAMRHGVPFTDRGYYAGITKQGVRDAIEQLRSEFLARQARGRPHPTYGTGDPYTPQQVQIPAPTSMEALRAAAAEARRRQGR